MSKINIEGNEIIDDMNYRYQMEPIMVNYRGKNQGAKTLILNISIIAQQLERNVLELCEFFKHKYNTRINYDSDAKVCELKGTIMRDVLQDDLRLFIQEFIICNQCGLPETEYRIKKTSKKLRKKCRSCGFKQKLEENKLTKFILKLLDT